MSPVNERRGKKERNKCVHDLCNIIVHRVKFDAFKITFSLQYIQDILALFAPIICAIAFKVYAVSKWMCLKSCSACSSRRWHVHCTAVLQKLNELSLSSMQIKALDLVSNLMLLNHVNLAVHACDTIQLAVLEKIE